MVNTLLNISKQYCLAMDRFRTIDSFVRVATAGSFSSAAKQLGMSRALVSLHVTDLEKRLGVRLLNRTTRSLTLTEVGASYLEYCQRMGGDERAGILDHPTAKGAPR